MKARLLFSLLFVALLSVSFIGCSGNGSTKTSASTSQATSTTIDSSATVNDSNTISDIVNSYQEGIFVEGSNGAVEPITSTYTDKDKALELSSDYKNIVGSHKDRQAKIEEYFGTPTGTLYRVSTDGYQHLNRAGGERLLLVTSASTGDRLFFKKLIDSGYCQPENVQGDLYAYDSIAGVDLSNYKSSSSNYEMQDALGVFVVSEKTKYVICSGSSRTLDVGWYEGTSYKKGSLPLTQPYVVACDTFGIAMEKTKDGYAVLNVSDIPSGLYGIELDSRYYVVAID